MSIQPLDKSLSRKISILVVASFLSGALSVFILNPFVTPFFDKLFPGFASRMQGKDNVTTVTVASLNNLADLHDEEQVFMDAYTQLYEGLNVANLNDVLHKKFEGEKNLLRDKKIIGFHVCINNKVVAWMSLMPLEHEKKMRIMRCAIHPSVSRVMVAHVLSNYVFSRYPDIDSLVNVCLKSSTLEKSMLIEFGFKECPLVDKAYDATLYTSFEYQRMT